MKRRNLDAAPSAARLLAWVNGRFTRSEAARISIHDRGFLYGDGVFETILIQDGQPVFWRAHLARLREGAARLKLPLDGTQDGLGAIGSELIRRNCVRAGVLRIAVSRGPGPRGYSPRAAGPPTWVLTAVPFHPGQGPTRRAVRLMTSSVRLDARQPWNAVKSANRLLQIMARAEADAAGADEALLLTQEGWVAEASAANLFWIEGSRLCTPALTCGVLPGITRQAVIEMAPQLGFRVHECRARRGRLLGADAVFLTSSLMGIRRVASLDGVLLVRSAAIRRFQVAWQAACSRHGGGFW